MAAILTAARLARPLAQLAVKAPHLTEAPAGRQSLPELPFSATSLPGRRPYATEVEEIGERPVLITGCDSGFGFALAKHLHEKGFIIYAGCLLKVGGA
ncbi:D-beta-hydroxybutyrate dehydrogenase, mitochondrial [Varanus komodoensis]|nr:D-beta-hydroxybutyrate dehydrogenase, mitochondrial [Varanus komodoensis]